MNDPVAAVKPNGRNDEGKLHRAEANGSRRGESAGPRFIYPSGSRPLEGYTVKRGLGHGGFGEVYYATSDAGKEVALKLIRRNLDVELRGVRQCLNLKHPNLLAIYDIRGDEQGDKWVVMEHVNGSSLENVIAAHPNGISEEDVLVWVHGVGAGVAYLHDHGIVHRDLKPGNIFSDEGVVKLGDYGLSKFISCSRRSGQTESVGTVHYMAPEVANGRYGKEIDIYALGVILFEMLTGRVPFEGESVGEVLMKHLTATPDVSMLSEPYRSVVARALEKDPAKRFPSVSEMLAGLPEPARTQVHVGLLPSGQQVAATGSSPFATTVPVAESIEEEPILRAVRQTISRLGRAWNESNLNTPTKIILLVIGLFAFMQMAGLLIPLAVVLLVLYACYWLVRSIVLAVNAARRRPGMPPGRRWRDASATAVAGAAAVAGGHPGAWAQHHVQGGRPVSARMHRWARRETAADVLVLKPLRERVTELIGSLLGSVLVAATMCLVMTMLSSFRSQVLRPEQFAWLLGVSVAGAWAVLLPSKFWEGSRGDAMLRRFVMMVAGLAVGSLAFALASLLSLDGSPTALLPYDVQIMETHAYKLPANFYSDTTPLLMAHMACFGTLFLAIRWWRQADPLRRTRLSLWSTVFCMLIALLVAWLWAFPQLWLVMVACAMAVSVQVSSLWLHPRRRYRRNNVQ